MFWLGLIIGLIVGFIGGVLFGRRNQKKVEEALNRLKIELENIKNKS